MNLLIIILTKVTHKNLTRSSDKYVCVGGRGDSKNLSSELDDVDCKKYIVK
jgi:hypothetical protein